MNYSREFEKIIGQLADSRDLQTRTAAQQDADRMFTDAALAVGPERAFDLLAGMVETRTGSLTQKQLRRVEAAINRAGRAIWKGMEP